MKLTISERGSVFSSLTLPVVLSAGGLAVSASSLLPREPGWEGGERVSFISRVEVDGQRSLAPFLERANDHLASLAGGISGLNLQVGESDSRLSTADELLGQLRLKREALEGGNADVYRTMIGYAVKVALTKSTREVIGEIHDDIAARRISERPITSAELEARIYLRTMFDLYDFMGTPRSLFVAALPESLALREEARTAFITGALSASEGEIVVSTDVNTIAQRTVDLALEGLNAAGDKTPTEESLSNEVRRVFQHACTVAQEAIDAEIARLASESPSMDGLPMPRYPHGPQPTPDLPDDWAKDVLKEAARKKVIDWAVKKGVEIATGIKPSLIGIILPAPPLNEGEDEMIESRRAREESQAAVKEMWDAYGENLRRERSGEGGYCDAYSSILDRDWGREGGTCGGDRGGGSSGLDGGTCNDSRDTGGKSDSCGGASDSGSDMDGGFSDDYSSILD